MITSFSNTEYQLLTKMEGFNQAKRLWIKLLGEKNTIFDKDKLKKLETATFLTKQKIFGVIFPENLKQIKTCLKIADNFDIPIYPVSTGKNWGYGSMVPIRDGVIINLSRMDKILDYNEKLAYVTVEPGVTFQKLYDFLLEKKSPLTVSTGGGSSQSSFIGNFAERGISKGVYGNIYENVCNLEIVLANGEVINTGFSDQGLSKLAPISREGVGPEIIGLFTQSNLGIITKMTLWLQPRPIYSRVLSFHINKEIDLIKTIEALRILKLEKTIDGNFLIANEFRALTSFQQYPWRESFGKTPLTKEIMKRLKNHWGLQGSWVGQVVLGASTKEELNGREKRIGNVLGKVVKMIYFKDLKDDFYKPNDFAVRSCYWRKKEPIPKNIDPDNDGCGVLWISPTVPFVGSDVYQAVKIMGKIMSFYGFEENIGISCLTDRKVYVIGSIVYDRFVKGEDEKALRCHDEIFNQLYKKGYFPYRLSIYSMKNLQGKVKSTFKFIKKIKKIIDPKNILAPGRYEEFYS